MSQHITISVDAVGGDLGSDPMLEGSLMALEADPNLDLVLCGPADVVEPFAACHDRIEACPTTEVIGMGEHPAQAVRKKKDSSIVVGCRLVKEGRAQGFFSPGSTGACLAAATLVMGRIKGVSRPAMATVLPSPVKPVVLCDVGANADCKPAYLVQFAQMATIYAERVLGVGEPKCALLNIGEEEAKGSQFAQETHALLKEQVPNFVGNCEGRDLLDCEADVIVTDGFTGNVALKTVEGVASVLFGSLKKIMKSSPVSMVGALTMRKGLNELKDLVSADTYGGAPMLGVKGACIVGHGSSNAVAVKNGILVAAKCARLDVSGLIAQVVKKPDIN